MASRLDATCHGERESSSLRNLEPCSTLSGILRDAENAALKISEMDGGSYTTLSEELAQSFPHNAQSFLDSAAATVLSRITSTLSEIDQRSKIDGVDMNECWRAVVLAGPVLHEIVGLYNQVPTRTSSIIRSKPFVDIGVQVPSSEEELSQIETRILEDQKGILKCYLALLRRPDIAERMRRYSEDISTRSKDRPSEHLMPHAQIGHTSSRGNTAGVTSAASEDLEASSSTYAPVRSAKALFYFETAEGFGQWPIYIAASATTDLRKLRKRSPVLFDAAVDKIRELSNGDFSSGNHVLLSDTEGTVPLFKARIADDSRLVYSVDCVPDLDADVDRQAIRIYGVYSHAQLSRRDRFWNELARDLGRQGEVYRDRCRQRSQPRNTGKNTYTPLMFPKLSEPTAPDGDVHLLPTGSTDADAMDLLALHRIVIFSKALLNSFLAELEIPFMAQPSVSETEIIEHDASCFVIGRSGTGKTWTMMYKTVAIMRSWELWDPERAMPRVMFVTRSSMLADHVHSTTIQLLEAFKLGSLTDEELSSLSEQRAQSTETLGGERRRGIPNNWSALEDKHFPLFVTVEELYSMLEADLVPTNHANDGDELDIGDESLLSSVSGNRFVKTYWSHFPRSLTKGLDPMSVFSEILGVVKGSEATLGTKEGRLTRTVYTSLSARTYPTFASQRDSLYGLFEAYVRHTRIRGERDAADRTHALLRRLDSARMPGLPVDFLFVDEVQDNLIIDMLLLRSLCNNPNGLFWAGDTAQTIAVGSSFTFNELKSMIHRLEKRQANPLQVPPSTFHLAVNYRSHSGITNCAQTVVDLLTTVWSDSLDRLGPEHGWRAGPKPIFLGSSGMDQLTAFERQYTRTSKLQLGSEQCVIVRDEAARDAFHSRGIATGLVITIYQSKGLEFDDVFLYHLFEDSPVSLKQWRTLCERTEDVTDVWAEEFRSICRELKMLYVALTRARQRLWIVDGSELALPMVNLWTRRNVIETHSRENGPLTSSRHSSSTDWAKQGKQFMDKREFDLARQCFESAGLPLERDIAEAYLLQETASNASEYSSTAEAFEACAKMVTGERSKQLLLASAACHHRAGDWAKSAAAFLRAGEFTKCVRQYCKAGMMEDARQVILCHRDDVHDNILKQVCMHFFDINERSKAIDMFSSTDEAVGFMKAHKLYRALAPFLEDLQRIREAAEVYLHDLHDVPHAVDLFFQDPEDAVMVARGTQELLKGLWLRLTVGSKDGVHSQHAVLPSLVLLATRRLSMSDVSYGDSKEAENELSAFVAIAEKNIKQLLRLGLQLSHSTSRYQALVAVSLDFAFTFLLDESGPLESDTLMSTPSLLPAFRVYSKVSTEYDNGAIWKAYGVHKVSGKKLGSYALPRASFLYNTAVALAVVGQTQNTNNEGEVEITSTSVIRVLRAYIGARLRRRTSIVAAACQRLDILRLCVSYAFTGCCPRSSHVACTADHYPVPSDPHPLDETHLHIRLRIVTQLVLVYETQPCESTDDAIIVWQARCHWMESFLVTIYVPFFELGSLLTVLRPDLVPELKEACRVLRSWICEILFAARQQQSRGTSSRISDTLRIRAIPRAALLSYVLDRIDDHLRDTTSNRQAIPPFLWYTASYEILTEKLAEHSSAHESSHYQMPGALLYLRFLLERGETHFHRGIMAHLAQGLCSAFILSDRGRRPLNNIILSRRWLVNLADLWTTSHAVHRHDRGHVWDLLDLFPSLLERLPLAEGEATVTGEASNVIMDEMDSMSKALFYLGYWHSEFKNDGNKSCILKILSDISKDCPKPHYLYVFQDHQDNWDALRMGIVWSIPPRSREWDQLVEVQVADSGKHGKPPGKVVRVIHNSLDHLLSILPLPDKAYASIPFPTSWLQARLSESRPPSPAVRAPDSDEVSKRSPTPADLVVVPSPEAVETHESLVVRGATSDTGAGHDVEGIARDIQENDEL